MGMSWLGSDGVERRPIVLVEDHLYHTSEMLAALAATRADLVSELTVCVIERAGPDTTATVAGWLERYPTLQVAARVDAAAVPAGAASRLTPVDAADLRDAAACARLVARLLRPGGLLVQDVQLETLPFLPADRWWESIYVAATVRGLFADRQPTVRFLSNKRGYAATFGRDLVDAGYDARDVMDKSSLGDVVVPTIASLVDRLFPRTLDAVLPPRGAGGEVVRRTWRVGADARDRREVFDACDLVLWQAADSWTLGGRMVDDVRGERTLGLRPGSHEAETWRGLIAECLGGSAGLPVIDVGQRVSPPHAERAELTNLAARHIHTLRGRLADAGALITADHAYRLRDGIRAGLCCPASPILRPERVS